MDCRDEKKVDKCEDHHAGQLEYWTVYLAKIIRNSEFSKAILCETILLLFLVIFERILQMKFDSKINLSPIINNLVNGELVAR